MLALGAAAPLVAQAPQQQPPVPADAVELGMKVIDIRMNEARAAEVRTSLQNTIRQVQSIRAYKLKPGTEPALSLGVFDAD
jgi:hypothetical protein